MEGVPLPARLWLLATSHLLPRCLHVVAEAGVADHLGEAPVSVDVLARESGCDAGALNRMLRLLSTAGVFERVAEGWTHTELSRLLRTDQPHSMRAFVRMIGGRVQWAAAGELGQALASGQAAIETVVPGGLWPWFADNPEEARIFDAAMTSKSIGEIAALIPAFDFKPYRVIADVGGGRGHVLAAILEATPGATGVLFDLPHVVAAVTASPRLELRGGDFFRDALPGADAYVVSQVLHDWPDEKATAILRAVRQAAHAGSHLLVLEQVMAGSPGPHPSKVLDIVMLTLTGGRERTQEEYARLFDAAGFRLERVVPTASPVSVLVGIPA
jgi:hypothetical protein